VGRPVVQYKPTENPTSWGTGNGAALERRCGYRLPQAAIAEKNPHNPMQANVLGPETIPESLPELNVAIIGPDFAPIKNETR
jgi:hypothetical protein